MGRALCLHGTDLHRAGMRAQHMRRAVIARVAVHEKRIMLLPCGVFGRNVQRVEIIPVAFNLRTFGNGKAHIGKNGGQFFHDLADGVDRAHRACAARQGHIQPFGFQTRIQRCIL